MLLDNKHSFPGIAVLLPSPAPAGTVTWATAHGKKRPDYPPMPPFAHLGPGKLNIITGYLLATAPE